MSQISLFGKSILAEQSVQTISGGSHSQKRPFLRPVIMVLTICAVLLMTLGFSAPGIVRTQTQQPTRKLTAAQKAKLPELKIVSVNIRRVATILNREGVYLEAGLLFTPAGRKKAGEQLAAYPDMYLSKVHSEPLQGVVMADTLTLPEKVKVESDTVIIARNVIFNGRAPIIKGPHDVHLFVLGSAKAANGPKTVITIDTSGYGRDEWLASQRQLADRTSRRDLILTFCELRVRGVRKG